MCCRAEVVNAAGIGRFGAMEKEFTMIISK